MDKLKVNALIAGVYVVMSVVESELMDRAEGEKQIAQIIELLNAEYHAKETL
jgi:hypothetical protein